MSVKREEQYFSNLVSQRNTIKEIRLFNAFDFFSDKWNRIYNQYALEQINFTKEKSKLVFFSEVLIVTTYAIGGGIIIFDLNPDTAAGSLLATLHTIQLFQSSISSTSKYYSTYKGASIFVSDFINFTNYAVNKEYRKVSNSNLSEITNIKIKDFTFKYPNQNSNSLNNINLEINKGDRVEIVGENGCGKTTLMKCILGLYTPKSESIFVNDVPLREIDITVNARIKLTLFAR
ncbi:ATP-binding cassette domain-containing protein [Cytobacillus firmus]|uniref:ATP-binding cassette domain-containing protein n=1 Tax=Cytobacillus firmus TaxID=1399 RepID=UPI0018CD6273|nr:ATP-binding cassette domain-containing protein [Cytobacillus firmus]